MFDGSVIFPIRGIDKYFDPTETVCINFAYIEKARGWYDTTYKEYNLLIPSGSAQTTNNVWLVYDLIRKKWFEKDTGTASVPQAGFTVSDVNGNNYVYGGVDSGYLVRLENGTTWGGTDIDYALETGDFLPSKSIWDKTLLRYVKFIARANATDNLDITYAADTDTTPAALVSNIDLTASGFRLKKYTAPINKIGWTHRLKFTLSSDSVARAFEPLGYAIQWQYVRDDLD